MSSIKNPAAEYTTQLENLSLDLFFEEEVSRLRAVETLASGIPTFQALLPEIAASPQRVQSCLRSYEEISHQLHKFGAEHAVAKSLKAALDALKPGMGKLAQEHPKIAEQRMLVDTKLFYDCESLLFERLSHLQRRDFLFYLARHLEWHSTDHDLPSILCKLHPFLRTLEEQELVQLGALIHREEDRREFAAKYGLSDLEKVREEFLHNFEKVTQNVGGGVCFTASFTLIAQEFPDPNGLDWKRLRYIQNISQIGGTQCLRLYQARLFEKFETENPNYRDDYPHLLQYALKRLGFEDLENYRLHSGDVEFRRLRKILFWIVYNGPYKILQSGAVREECRELRKAAMLDKILANPFTLTDTVISLTDTVISGLPTWLLGQLHLHSFHMVFEKRSMDWPFIDLLQTHKDGLFLVFLEDHAFVFSLKGRWYCDTNDYDIITQKIHVRQFPSNEEMLPHLQRYIQLRYPSEEKVSLAQIERDP